MPSTKIFAATKIHTMKPGLPQRSVAPGQTSKLNILSPEDIPLPGSQSEMVLGDTIGEYMDDTSCEASQTPTSLSNEQSPPGSATPKASRLTVLDEESLILRLHELALAPNNIELNSQNLPLANDELDHGGDDPVEDLEDEEQIEDHKSDVDIQADLVPDDTWERKTKVLNYTPLRCEYPNASTKQSIVTLFDLLRVSIPNVPEAYDVDALLETKSISNAELDLSEEHQLRKIVYLPELVSQLFPKAHNILQQFTIDWNNPEVNRFIAKVHPSLTSTSMPVTTWSEDDIVTWSGSVIGRPTMEVIHAVLMNRMDGTHDARRKYPNIASCHHKDPVVPDMGVVRKGNHSKTADLAVTIEVKTKSAYQIKGTELGKFDDLQSLRSDDQIGKAMKYSWPEGTLNSDNDSQTRMLAQVWTQMVYKNTRLCELTTVESTTFMARGTGSQSDTMFMSPAYGCEDCPLLAAFCWHAMATNLFSIEDLNLPSNVDTEWWGYEITQFEGMGVAPASLYTYEKTLTNRQAVLGRH